MVFYTVKRKYLGAVVFSLIVFSIVLNYYLSKEGGKSSTYLLNVRAIEKTDNEVEDYEGKGESIPFRSRSKYFKSTSSKTKRPKLLDSGLNSSKVKKYLTASFMNGLKKYSDSNKTIILSLVDSNYLNFALNFYKLSITRNSLENFAFLSVDERAFSVLNNLSIPCLFFDFPNPVKNSSMPSDFGTVTYLYKTNLKTAVMIQALHLKYSILMVDVDVILFKNPFPYFTCSHCSIHAQLDRQMYNSGFIFVRPTDISMQIYETSWNFFIHFQTGNDQSYLNMAINHWKTRGELVDLFPLDKNKFPCGIYYFEHVHRSFENKPPCSKCIMVHNNYIASAAAKQYRLKENHLWIVDDNGYYSNIDAKFLTYENPILFRDQRTMDVEIRTLKVALAIASVLKRILILPTFHCCNCPPVSSCSHPKYRCSLLSVLKINKFDKHFSSLYREHSFLTNPLVSEKMKLRRTPILLINSSIYNSHVLSSAEIPLPEIIFEPRNFIDGATLEEIETWLKPYSTFPVMRFHSLYGVLGGELQSSKFTSLRNTLEEAFECSIYEQWDKNVV